MPESTIVQTYELTPVQQGMLFQALSDNVPGVDLLQAEGCLDESIDVERFMAAWRWVISRHGALRTSFRMLQSGELVQDVHAALDLPAASDDWSALPTDEQDSRWRALVDEERLRGFDMLQPPLMRVVLVRLGEQRFRFLWTLHHALVDGRIVADVLEDLFAFYDAPTCGREPDRPSPRPFVDYVRWLSALDTSGAQAFWKETLRGFTAATSLGVSRPAKESAAGFGALEIRLSSALTEQLHVLAKSCSASMGHVLQGAWSILLQRYSREQDIVFGMIRTLRMCSLEGAPSIVGPLINTLPVRVVVDPKMSLATLLQTLRRVQRHIGRHEHTPLLSVQEWSDVPRGTPLFNTIVVFDTMLMDTRLRRRPGNWQNRSFSGAGQTSFDVTLLGWDESEFVVRLEYYRRALDDDAAARLLGHLRNLLEAMPAHASDPIGQLPLMSPAERDLLLAWNQTEAEYPRDAPLAKLIEEQVERSPEEVAVVCGGASIRYAELNERANQLARELRGRGVGPDHLVGLLVERSIDMIVALLAIVKSGAAYLPLDPLLPRDRLSYMVEDSGLSLIVTQKRLRDALPSLGDRILSVDGDGWASNSRENLDVSVGPDALAYVIYTSGSTGRPKGVEVPRGALINLLWSMRDWLGLTARDRLLAVTTISFDIAGVDVWLPLLVGARMVVATREEATDGARLREQIDHHGITFLQATPVTWRLLLEAGWKGKADLQIVCTGEAMPRDLSEQLHPIVARLWNLYGPTETTIWSTGYLVRDAGPILIGRPVANTQCYVLDENLQQVPVGVVGELYIGGDGLARGYRNRPDLTAEKFVPDPFRPERSARMYRTGDLARYLADGNLECLGRTDHQVKIRGFRIELGEIEAVLKEEPRVAQAVVVAREDTPGDHRLVAYIVPRGETMATRNELRAWLKQRLPEYMVPTEYVTLGEIPISPNGKVDRRALPAPERGPEEEGSSASPAAPRTEAEHKVAAIVREVLGLAHLGIHDDFFDLGGNSLTAVRVISRINQEFRIDLLVRVLFEAKTCAELAAQVEARLQRDESAEPEAWPVLVPIQTKGTRRPLFCVARPNVNALGYVFLARRLDEDQPVYGLQAQLWEDPRLDFTPQQYLDTARKYLEAVRVLQPRGPYQFIGQCQGSYIAFEMARQLEAEGETVSFLGILDTWVEENTRRKSLFFAHILYSRLKAGGRRLLRTIRGSVSSTSESAVSEPGSQAASGGEGDALPPSKLTFNERWRHYFPGKGFEPPVVDARITVFPVQGQAFYRISDPSLGWRHRTRTGIHVEPIGGDHLTHLREPHVDHLAQRIRALLQYGVTSRPELEGRVEGSPISLETSRGE
jgi:amino acid adenylation domain-containing protein